MGVIFYLGIIAFLGSIVKPNCPQTYLLYKRGTEYNLKNLDHLMDCNICRSSYISILKNRIDRQIKNIDYLNNRIENLRKNIDYVNNRIENQNNKTIDVEKQIDNDILYYNSYMFI
jgi:wobble nucleotide-excising tRNase